MTNAAEKQPGKKARRKWHERSAEKDIRYRGPLNYQHFQIFGWLCIIASQAVLILTLAKKLNMLPARFAGLQEPAMILSWLALPFLLIANFAQIINGRQSYAFLLAKNFGAAAAVYAVYAFFLSRYVIGTIDLLNDRTVSSVDALSKIISGIDSSGIVAFNIFIDLSLCTLVMFFLNYRPKKIFTGKSRLVFRSFALLPIAYEIACIVLKVMASRNRIRISPFLYPLFTVKPTMTFVLFIVLAFYIKTRELRFRRHGKTHEEYTAFLRTNRNSWEFSRFLAIALVVVGILDLFIVFWITGMEMSQMGDAAEALESHTLVAFIMGFGDSIRLLLLAPLVLLFSYTRQPRNPTLGMVIPAVSFGLILLLYLEAGHQALQEVNLPKMNLEEMMNPAPAESLTEESIPAEALLELLTKSVPAEEAPAGEKPSEEASDKKIPAEEAPGGKTSSPPVPEASAPGDAP